MPQGHKKTCKCFACKATRKKTTAKHKKAATVKKKKTVTKARPPAKARPRAKRALTVADAYKMGFVDGKARRRRAPSWGE